MKTLAFGEGSMKTVNTGTVVPLEKCPFRAFPSRPALYAGRLLTNVGAFVGAHLCAKHFATKVAPTKNTAPMEWVAQSNDVMPAPYRAL